MELLARVVFSAVFVFLAFAYEEDESFKENLEYIRSELINLDDQIGIECTRTYNTRVHLVNNQLTEDTNICLGKANQSKQIMDEKITVLGRKLRGNLNCLSKLLSNCTDLVDNTMFLTCVISNYNTLLRRLEAANEKSLIMQAKIASSQWQIEVITDGCINSAFLCSKSLLTRIGSVYNNCLNDAQLQGRPRRRPRMA